MSDIPPRQFNYRSPFLAATYLIAVVGAVFFAVLPIMMHGVSHKSGTAELPMQVYVVFGLMSLASFIGVIITYLNSRPILVDDDSITSLICGRRWKQVSWQNVRSVEKLRIYDNLFARHRSIIQVSSDTQCVQFSDWIGDFPTLLSKLNLYITKFQLPTYTVDRGRDTRRRIALTATDTAMRRKLLREGLRTKVSQL